MTQPNPLAPSVEIRQRNFDDANMMDLIEVSKKPGLHYRWVRWSRHDNFLAVSRAKMRGYKPVKQEDIEIVAEVEDMNDGFVHIGDSILMACPEDVYRKRETKKRIRREQILASATAQTEEMAKKKGIKVIPDKDHNEETRD